MFIGKNDISSGAQTMVGPNVTVLPGEILVFAFVRAQKKTVKYYQKGM
ncbi:hypothetical protein [Enterococcus gallinarum]|nr:hypothetical protein [Enterococcus gallinarum]